MLVIVGWLIVIGCVLGAYTAHGGHLDVLWQPGEFVIILGSGIGAYIVSNTKNVLKKTVGGIKDAMKGPKYTKQAYLELLSVLYVCFKLMKSKGALAIEAHVENPDASPLFANFPSFSKDHHAVAFFCDYMRLVTLGSENPHEMEALLDEELETHHAEMDQVPSAIQGMADGVPALGIVAAVLGVIHTMGSITEPPEVLGHLIGAALVGTFFGVLMCYGFIGPLASAIKGVYAVDSKYYQCIKVGIIGHLHGYAPAITVEYARKILPSNVRPTFYEVEETVNNLPPSV